MPRLLTNQQSNIFCLARKLRTMTYNFFSTFPDKRQKIRDTLPLKRNFTHKAESIEDLLTYRTTKSLA